MSYCTARDATDIRYAEEKRAFYVNVTRLTQPIKNRLRGLRYRRIAPRVSGAEFHYRPMDWNHPRRFVLIRRPVPEAPSAQLDLFQMEGFTYQVFVANLALKPLNLWRFCNKRATAELINRELKDAYGLGNTPTQDFAANEAFFQIVLLAKDFFRWLVNLFDFHSVAS